MDVGLTAIAVAAVIIFERARPLLLRLLDYRVPEKQELPKIPKDLVALALMESEEWAQREMMDGMRELYGDVADWDMVRSRYGVAQKA